MRIRPVILCGGSGTRLWPLSRTKYPKQFVELDKGHTLFRDTLRRAAQAAPTEAPVIVCSKDHRFYASSSLAAEGMTGSLILEPRPRGTAPAIALAALAARDALRRGETSPGAPDSGSATGSDEDILLLIMPSDHAIDRPDHFIEKVRLSVPLAEEGKLVTFGVTPTSPATGFGYIRAGEPEGGAAFRVESFIEKPDADTARAMLEAGGHLWNSGMFLFRAGTYLAELAVRAPAVLAACERAWEEKIHDLDFLIPGPAFLESPDISIDYAVMEHTDRAVVTPLQLGWNDLGSWESFYEIAPKDDAGNAVAGDVLTEESSGCYLRSDSRLIAALGVHDLTVVETKDAVLVASRERAQDVRHIVKALRDADRPESEDHLRVFRPWGSYETLVMADRFQVKRIVVNPRHKTSLQMHYHRAEHWVVVSGTAEIEIDGEARLYTENQAAYIPVGAPHRIKNPGNIPLVFIEVQSGAYLGEDDIVRLEDDYGRQDGAHKL